MEPSLLEFGARIKHLRLREVWLFRYLEIVRVGLLRDEDAIGAHALDHLDLLVRCVD